MPARKAQVTAGRRRRTRRSLRPLVAAFVLTLGLGCSWAFAGITVRENALQRAIVRTQAEIAAEEARRTHLEASAAQKKTPDYIIERARSLGWMWPWEAMVVVEQDRADANAATDEKTRPGRLQRWIAVFVGSR